MVLYNTLTRKKEEFVPAGEKALLYGCGPTVYNLFHIGNARMFVIYDVLRRYLAYKGVPFTAVQNFTDVDDKMINKAAESGESVKAVADRYIEEYFKDADGLNIGRADFHPLATENVGGMVEMIETLIEKGHAYEADGDVYFRVRSLPSYGSLSGQNVDDLESGARVEVDDRKESPLDFSLWKAKKEGEPFWPSPWGEGRPGWHIECSVMAKRYLGDTLDVHMGGTDLVFPHHENESAQSMAANGRPLSRFWLHNGYINVDGSKMSKSLGNFFTVRDVAERYDYMVIRFFLLSAHYRSPVNYSAELMESAKNAWERIVTCRENLVFLKGTELEGGASPGFSDKLASCKKGFEDALEDDLNTADALAAVFDLVRAANTAAAHSPRRGDIEAALALLEELCGTLGFRFGPGPAGEDGEVAALVAARQEARKARDFKTADEIRDRLKSMGVTLEDTPQGVKIVRE